MRTDTIYHVTSTNCRWHCYALTLDEAKAIAEDMVRDYTSAEIWSLQVVRDSHRLLYKAERGVVVFTDQTTQPKVDER